HPGEEGPDVAGQRALEVALLLPLHERLPEALALGEDHERDLLVLADLRALLGLGDGQVEAAELVHEADPLGVGPRPHPALRDLLARLVRLRAALRGIRHEVLVERLHEAADLGPLRVVPGPGLAEDRGMAPAAQDLAAHADLLVESAQAELAAEHADRAR